MCEEHVHQWPRLLGTLAGLHVWSTSVTGLVYVYVHSTVPAATTRGGQQPQPFLGCIKGLMINKPMTVGLRH